MDEEKHLGDYAQAAYEAYFGKYSRGTKIKYQDLILNERNRWKKVANAIIITLLSQDEKVVMAMKKEVDIFLQDQKKNFSIEEVFPDRIQ